MGESRAQWLISYWRVWHSMRKCIRTTIGRMEIVLRGATSFSKSVGTNSMLGRRVSLIVIVWAPLAIRWVLTLEIILPFIMKTVWRIFWPFPWISRPCLIRIKTSSAPIITGTRGLTVSPERTDRALPLTLWRLLVMKRPNKTSALTTPITPALYEVSRAKSFV